MKKKRLLTTIGSVCLILVLAALLLPACAPRVVEAPELEAKIKALEGELTSEKAEVSKLEKELAEAKEPAKVYELTAQSVWQPGTLEWTGDQWWLEEIEAVTGGRLKIEINPPGAIVAPFEQLDACSKKVIDVSFSWGGYWLGKNSAFALISSLPCGSRGLTTWMFMGWLLEGEGLEMYQELFDRMGYNVKALITQADYPEPLGWFNKEIKSLEDFKGLKYRAGGMGALVYEEMGMTLVHLSGGEIIPGLEKGLIDGAEWSDPCADEALGFPDVVKYYHYPGLHQTAACTEALFNKDVWNSLPDDLQAQIDTVCKARPLLTWTKGMTMFKGKLEELQTKKGVILCKTPPEVLEATMEAWDKVVQKECADNPDFKMVYESQKAYGEKMIYSYRLMYPDTDQLWDHYWPGLWD